MNLGKKEAKIKSGLLEIILIRQIGSLTALIYFFLLSLTDSEGVPSICANVDMPATIPDFLQHFFPLVQEIARNGAGGIRFSAVQAAQAENGVKLFPWSMPGIEELAVL